MNATDFLILLVDASGGSVQGRTLLQKRAFFVTVLVDLDVDLGFDAHFYGPYSSVVDNGVTQLKNLRFIEECVTAYGTDIAGFEMKRYDYKLTADGQQIAATMRESPEYRQIGTCVKRLSEAGNLNYMELSIAAKAVYILRKKAKGMSKQEIISEAHKFDWNIMPSSLETAVSFLEKLNVLNQ
jgi:uncharacterized protein YwgA